MLGRRRVSRTARTGIRLRPSGSQGALLLGGYDGCPLTVAGIAAVTLSCQLPLEAVPHSDRPEQQDVVHGQRAHPGAAAELRPYLRLRRSPFVSRTRSNWGRFRWVTGTYGSIGESAAVPHQRRGASRWRRSGFGTTQPGHQDVTLVEHRLQLRLRSGDAHLHTVEP